MALSRGIISAAKAAESLLSHLYLSVLTERSGLITFLLHSLFRSEREIESQLVDPLERFTLSHLRQVIEYYQSRNYRFVSPQSVLDGLSADGRYVMLTFDDGYYNNSLAVPVLEKYAVPATFFVSTSHVRKGKSFWWDVLYRELSQLKVPAEEIALEAEQLKRFTTEEIEQRLQKRFGKEAFTPRSDIDRPFSEKELREFASHELVYIGNHTANHAILTNYDEAGIRSQIVTAQEDLREITGAVPSVISYPNGNHSDMVVRIAAEAGLALGISVIPRKNRVPIVSGTQAAMRLGRFILYGNRDLLRRCELYRSDLLFYERCKRLLRREKLPVIESLTYPR